MIFSAFARTTLLTLLAMFTSCARPAYRSRGYASYIADQYVGRMTSSGYPYNPNEWTAAHNNLPFGTQVTVKNNHNGRSVTVTINDRFPYYPNRVINLSRIAAQYIQIPYHQMADVTVTARKLPAGYQQQTYSAPAQASYGPPPASYGPPPTSYTAPPPTSYSTPPAGYGTYAPPAGLGAPPPGYPAAR